MKKVILIKYGELNTKKGNRNFFINALYSNIKDKLKGYEISITKDNARMCIEFLDNDLESIKKCIDTVFGIHKYHIAYVVDNDIDTIKEKAVEVLKSESFNTFKVETKRSNKKFPYNSMEVSPIVASHILKNIEDIKVDVHNPEMLVNVEIRDKESYIYLNSYSGLGGYPVGTQSKALLMLSGGIDSPVAGYLAMKRGIKVDCVYFEAIPHTSLDARNKVIELTKKLTNYTNSINLHVINFTKIQEEIYKKSKEEYCITIMRRMMYRIMEKLTYKYKACAVVNGESIGQVASQTLTSVQVINNVTSIPFIRPVACLDKLEIIDIAKKIDTYEISILPFEDCCTVFVPKHPVINPKLDECLKIEEGIDYDTLIEETINDIYTIKVTRDDNNYDNLL